MITNFEFLTREMTEEEKKLVPILIKGFNTKTKDNPIKAPEIVQAINAKRESLGLKFNFSEVRLRKIVNFIRAEGILPLIATSNGYYCSTDKEEIKSQIESLTQRADAIMSSANGLNKFL
jgi:hypothetical protein